MKLLMVFTGRDGLGRDAYVSHYHAVYRILEDAGALDDCRIRLAAPVFDLIFYNQLHAALTRDVVRNRPDMVQLIIGAPADVCKAQQWADMFKDTEVRVVVLMGDGATSEHAAAIAKAGVTVVLGPAERKQLGAPSAAVRYSSTYMSTWLRGFYTSLASQPTKAPEPGADADPTEDLDRVVHAYEAARKAMKELVADASVRVGAGAVSGTAIIPDGDNAADDCEHRYERFFHRLADVELVDAMRIYTAPIAPYIAIEHVDMVRWLLKRHDDPTTNDHELFFAACGTCNCDMVRTMLEDPRIDPSARGNKALIDALRSGNSIAKLLMSDERVVRSMQARSC